MNVACANARAEGACSSLLASLAYGVLHDHQQPMPSPHTPAHAPSQLRDWLHVISSSKAVYELRYYNIHDQDADEDED